MSDASHITSYEHGGNVHAAADRRNVTVDELLDFSANINPMGAPEWLRACVSRELDSILHYPDPTAEALRRKAAERYQVAAERVLVANGSTELLYHLPTVLQCRRALIPVPCYVDYLKVMEIADIPAHLLPLAPGKAFQPDADEIDANLRPGDLLIVGSPNNPTGCVFPAEKIRQLAAAHPQVMFVVDEAFLEFVPGAVSVAGGADNIITLHSLTKFYAIPGLRLGFGVFPEDIAARLKRLLPPWSVNSLAQKVGERAIVDDTYQQESRAFCA
ncbi:MAG: aminotransferase class I/II-fold pyridoxal phosphate-dependent enzyme, partial [Thermodesulfobacteriota bacterium]